MLTSKIKSKISTMKKNNITNSFLPNLFNQLKLKKKQQEKSKKKNTSWQ
jgi:hypothetical protein